MATNNILVGKNQAWDCLAASFIMIPKLMSYQVINWENVGYLTMKFKFVSLNILSEVNLNFD